MKEPTWGHALDLLVAGLVLFLLFVATYSQRRTWVTLGSTALTIGLIAGFAFLSTAKETNPVRDGLKGLAAALPAGWDRRAMELANAVEQASVASAAARKRAAERPPERIFATSMWSISDWFDWDAWSWGSSSEAALETEAEPEPAKAAAPPEPSPAIGATASPEPELASEAPGAPIKWFLDAQLFAPDDTFAVTGANVSDQPLKVVRAELKPDGGAGKLTLALDVEGIGDTGAMVPPGARFRLKAEELTASQAEQRGGAILSVAYEQAGRRKTSIMYLTQAALAAGTANN